MSIKKRLIYLAIFIFSSLVALGVGILISLQHYQAEYKDALLMSDIQTMLFERRLATDAYHLSGNEADKQKWISAQAQLDHLLSKDAVFDAEDQRKLQKQIQDHFQKSKQLFQQLSSLYEASKLGKAVSEAEKNKIKAEMNKTTSETVLAVSSLSKSILVEEEDAFLLIVGITVGGLLYFLILLIFALQTIRKSISAIEDKEIELENILNTLPVGVFLVDYPDGKPILVNKTGIAMLGKGVDPKANKDNYSSVYSLVTADGSPYPSKELPLSIALTTGKTAEKKEIFIQKPNGNKIALHVSAVPVLDSAGNMYKTFAVFNDVTKEREIDRMKNEFISLASHQLRTPLSATKWFLEMLIKGDAGKLTSKQMEFVHHVNESNERMIELVGALLNVSRIESGRLIVEPVMTDITELIKTLISDMKKMFEEKEQTLTVDVAKDIPQIPVDRKLIRQVYLNLLTNANKYTPDHGKITITVVKQNGDILSTVADNGYGIPKEEKPKIFQKFFRGTNILSTVPTGTGLGLYLVKAIIESSNGRIWFESDEGKGTTFFFTLPLSGMQKKKGEVSIEEA